MATTTIGLTAAVPASWTEGYCAGYLDGLRQGLRERVGALEAELAVVRAEQAREGHAHPGSFEGTVAPLLPPEGDR